MAFLKYNRDQWKSAAEIEWQQRLESSFVRSVEVESIAGLTAPHSLLTHALQVFHCNFTPPISYNVTTTSHRQPSAFPPSSPSDRRTRILDLIGQSDTATLACLSIVLAVSPAWEAERNIPLSKEGIDDTSLAFKDLYVKYGMFRILCITLSCTRNS